MLAACADKPKKRQNRYLFVRSDFVRSDESFSPIIDEEVQVFESIYRDAKLTPIYTNEYDAIKMLMNDSLQLVIASRNFTKMSWRI